MSKENISSTDKYGLRNRKRKRKSDESSSGKVFKSDQPKDDQSSPLPDCPDLSTSEEDISTTGNEDEQPDGPESARKKQKRRKSKPKPKKLLERERKRKGKKSTTSGTALKSDQCKDEQSSPLPNFTTPVAAFKSELSKRRSSPLKRKSGESSTSGKVFKSDQPKDEQSSPLPRRR